jgi:hypothetical protein|nr:MAG TPA: Thaumarchaeal output domain 1 [Caudoviricetes sp.]
MITDDKRHEVAEKMRGYDGSGFKESAIVPFLDCLGVGYLNWREVLDTLADLIDRPTTTRHGKFKTKYGRETPCCEVCGYSIGDMRWNYCPKCGAAITDD